MRTGVEVYLEASVRRPYQAVAELLRSSPDRWLPASQATGEAVVFPVGLGSERRGVRRRVRATLGSVQPFGYGLAVRLAWQAERRPELYPTLEAVLRLERGDDAGQCRLRFDAIYRPPAGRIGAVLDQGLMHRVADASLHDFLARLVDRLERASDPAAEGKGSERRASQDRD